MRNILTLSILGLLATSAVAQEKIWAAQANPYGPEQTSPVWWGMTNTDAVAGALKACKAPCGQTPALARISTHNLFVRTCCDNGTKINCIILPEAGDGEDGRNASFDEAIGAIEKAGIGISTCYIHSVFDIKTGKKLKP
jgi:hypothetical protein